MAFEVVSGKVSTPFLKSNELEEGESITGYLIGFEESRFKDNETKNILLEKADGEMITLVPHGTLRYMEKDVAANRVKFMYMTKITRKGTYHMSKVNKDVPKFEVAQDFADLKKGAEAKIVNPSAVVQAGSDFAKKLDAIKKGASSASGKAS